MFTKKVKLRFFLLLLSIILASFVVFFIMRSLEDNVVYFYSPSEVYKKSDISFEKKIRIGGLVKENSIKKNENSINFVITDLKKEIVVSYQGLLPNLFAEGKGVVAEGKLKDKKYFIAENILAKHDENYMPPEVSKALENSNN
tara:strand:+ start:11670 stop:12098 length:429 start_codon:yes stop_codon:yes gene_type:complete